MLCWNTELKISYNIYIYIKLFLLSIILKNLRLFLKAIFETLSEEKEKKKKIRIRSTMKNWLNEGHLCDNSLKCPFKASIVLKIVSNILGIIFETMQLVCLLIVK